jgi:hypothetical protein
MFCHVSDLENVCILSVHRHYYEVVLSWSWSIMVTRVASPEGNVL